LYGKIELIHKGEKMAKDLDDIKGTWCKKGFAITCEEIKHGSFKGKYNALIMSRHVKSLRELRQFTDDCFEQGTTKRKTALNVKTGAVSTHDPEMDLDASGIG
jgi:hypothetical protein